MAEKISWTPAWTDEKLFKTVLAQNSGLFKKFFRTLIRGSTWKVSFSPFEYSYHSTDSTSDSEPLYFQKEADFAQHLEVKSIEDVTKELENTSKQNKPFVTQIETTLISSLSIVEYCRFALNYLLNVPEIPRAQKNEILKLISLPDGLLKEKIVMNERSENGFPFALADKYVNPILHLHPDLIDIIHRLAVEEKILLKNNFREQLFFVYFNYNKKVFSKVLPVYFPVTAKESLPNELKPFPCRVIGIVSYNENLPLATEEKNHYFIRAVSLLKQV